MKKIDNTTNPSKADLMKAPCYKDGELLCDLEKLAKTLGLSTYEARQRLFEAWPSSSFDFYENKKGRHGNV